jgi:hypothetical protein
MQRHPFDPVSAFFGIVFTGAALIVLMTDEVVFAPETRWVWPIVILVAGIALIASGLARTRDERNAGVGQDPSLPADPSAD